MTHMTHMTHFSVTSGKVRLVVRAAPELRVSKREDRPVGIDGPVVPREPVAPASLRAAMVIVPEPGPAKRCCYSLHPWIWHAARRPDSIAPWIQAWASEACSPAK
jgi:hypothetical protein